MKSQNYIDGQWVGASDGQTFAQRNPADLEHVTGEWPQGTCADAEQAIEAAHAAFPRGPRWECTSGQSTCREQSRC